MNEVHQLYFHWLVEKAEGNSQAYERLCWMLHQVPFTRRVGKDMNRANDGMHLRLEFVDSYLNLDPAEVNEMLEVDCSWLEMLVALTVTLDYLYDGGVRERFIELTTNMGLEPVLMSPGIGQDPNPYDEVDQELVDLATRRVDENLFDADGRGGLFPLLRWDPRELPDQREVEIWDQHAAYFRERLEGVLWTSID